MTTKLRTVTVQQLIDALETARDDYGADAPVLVATQPSYPITQLIDAVSGYDENGEAYVWIGASQPGSWVDVSPYAPRSAFDDEYL